PDLRVRQDGLGLAGVGLDGGGVRVPCEDGLAVRDGHRINVDVDDARVRVRLLGDLVDVAGGRAARADVEELVDAPGVEALARPAQEGAVGLHGQRRVGG